MVGMWGMIICWLTEWPAWSQSVDKLGNVGLCAKTLTLPLLFLPTVGGLNVCPRPTQTFVGQTWGDGSAVGRSNRSQGQVWQMGFGRVFHHGRRAHGDSSGHG